MSRKYVQRTQHQVPGAGRVHHSHHIVYLWVRCTPVLGYIMQAWPTRLFVELFVNKIVESFEFWMSDVLQSKRLINQAFLPSRGATCLKQNTCWYQQVEEWLLPLSDPASEKHEAHPRLSLRSDARRDSPRVHLTILRHALDLKTSIPTQHGKCNRITMSSWPGIYRKRVIKKQIIYNGMVDVG